MSYRTIEVNGREWRWRVGKTFVEIRSPDGQKFLPRREDLGEMAKVNPEFEYMGRTISPKHIAEYIKTASSRQPR